MYSRRTLLTSAAGGVLATALLGRRGLELADAAGEAEGTRFTRTEEPALSLLVPAGWDAVPTWDSSSVNPVPLVAVRNGSFPVTTFTQSSSPTPLGFPPDGILITVSAFSLTDEPVYAPSEGDPRAFSAKSVAIGADSGVADIKLANAWLVGADGNWGYMVSGLVGPRASRGELGKLVGMLNSVRLG